MESRDETLLRAAALNAAREGSKTEDLRKLLAEARKARKAAQDDEEAAALAWGRGVLAVAILIAVLSMATALVTWS